MIGVTVMPRGGYQQPRNPAPVSAPGRLSRRTDGGPAQTTTPMTGLPYGENKEYNDVQSSAPLSATPGAASTNPDSGMPAGGGRSAVPIFSPSARPDEPVTAGVDFGPGPGSAPMGFRPRRLSQVLSEIANSNPDSDAAEMLAVARRLGY